MDDLFKTTINDYLIAYAKENAEFNNHFIKEEKNIDNCVKYILNKVKETKRQGFADEEIYEFARNYYLEENLEIKDPGKCNIVINKSIAAKKVEPKKEKSTTPVQQSLFE